MWVYNPDGWGKGALLNLLGSVDLLIREAAVRIGMGKGNRAPLFPLFCVALTFHDKDSPLSCSPYSGCSSAVRSRFRQVLSLGSDAMLKVADLCRQGFGVRIQQTHP